MQLPNVLHLLRKRLFMEIRRGEGSAFVRRQIATSQLFWIRVYFFWLN